ncbi:MAG: hypothetical protein V4601_12185 [Pseudomonadota bacterium]
MKTMVSMVLPALKVTAVVVEVSKDATSSGTPPAQLAAVFQLPVAVPFPVQAASCADAGVATKASRSIATRDIAVPAERRISKSGTRNP